MIITRLFGRGVSAVCAAALLLALFQTGCGAGESTIASPTNTQVSAQELAKQERKKVRAAADDVLSPFEKGSLSLEGGQWASLEQLNAFGVDPQEFVDHLAGRFSYSIEDVDVDGNDAVARVRIDHVDLEQAVALAGEQATLDDNIASLAESYTKNDNQALMQGLFDLLLEQIDTSDTLITDELDMVLVKDGDEWNVDSVSVEELVSLFLGGMDLSAYL